MEDLSSDPLFFCLLHLFFSSPFLLCFSQFFFSFLHYKAWLSICCCLVFQEQGWLLCWLFVLCQCFPLWRLYPDVWQPNIIAFAEFTDICISWIMSVKMKWWDISMQWREFRRAVGRSYLSAICHDRLISEILNCKAARILAEMKAIALILSVVWTKAIYSFAKLLTCQSSAKLNARAEKACSGARENSRKSI